MRSSLPENLAEHSLSCAMIAHALAVIGREYFGRGVDPDRAACVAIFHDAAEILTGDLPTPVKYYNPAIQTAYKAVEESARQKLFSLLPDEMAPHYHSLLEAQTADPELWEVVKAADRLSAYIKCIEEEKAGNDEFRSAKAQIEARLGESQLGEVSWFMEYIIPGYLLTLDEQGQPSF